MKTKTIQNVSFIAILILITACNGTKPATKEGHVNSTETLDGTFGMETVNGKRLANTSLEIVFNLAENSFGGSTDCNQIFGSFTLEGKNIQIGPVGATRVYCEGKMDTEKSITEAFPKAKTYTLKNKQLTFFDENGEAVFTALKK